MPCFTLFIIPLTSTLPVSLPRPWRLLPFLLLLCVAIGPRQCPGVWLTPGEPQSPPNDRRRYLSECWTTGGTVIRRQIESGAVVCERRQWEAWCEAAVQATYGIEWDPAPAATHHALQSHPVRVDYCLPSTLLLRGSTERQGRWVVKVSDFPLAIPPRLEDSDTAESYIHPHFCPFYYYLTWTKVMVQ